MTKKVFLSLCGCLFGFAFTYAQMPESFSSAEIYLRLRKLNVLGSVLYVAAHPDDENSRLIAYLAKDRQYRTGYLSMTRGDGGQNLIGDEQGIELGLIRTQEMLAARRIDGAEQFFTRAFDFGFSKSTEEALKTWDKEKILSDVVWVIRRFRPDVMITRFPEVFSQAFHGHHSGSAVLAHEAFTAAADPNRFPEQFKYGVKPWQVKRLMWNTFNFGGPANTTSEDQLKLDVGAFNAIIGKSYGEIAAESRTQHKSQGAALTRTRGSAIEFFKTIAGESPAKDIMDGVNTSWSRVEGGAKIQTLVDELINDFSLAHPEKSVAHLASLYHELQQLKDEYWRTEKLKEVQQLIEACSGLWLEATIGNPYIVQGDSVRISVLLNNRLNTPAILKEIQVSTFDSIMTEPLTINKNYLISQTISIPADKSITQPYWLAEEMALGSYNVKDQLLIGEPQGKPAYEVKFRFEVEGQDITFTRPLQFKVTDPVKGDLYQPVTVLPPMTGRFEPEVVVFTNNDEKSFQVDTKKNRVGASANPVITLSNTRDLQLKQEGNFHNANFLYSAKPVSNAGAVFYSNLLLDKNGKPDSTKALNTISYDHIPRIDYFLPAKVKFVVTDVKTAGKRIGYIEGAGDKVPQALQQMGYDVVLLKEKDIVPGNLRQFDAILTGIRAHGVHPWLNDKYEVLMDYVKGGGNLVVQYERNNPFGNNAPMKIGPYPFNVSGVRVTDELAKVDFLQPAHPVMNFPNQITNSDFDGWIQERGIYFADRLDSAYQTIFSMHDEGEQGQKGSLIIADYGKGKFVYTGLVFFRELPAGVPGAYRLLANIIALNYKRGF